MNGLNTVIGSMYVQRTLIAAPVAPANAAVIAKPLTLTNRVFTPSVCARCSSPPIPASARPSRLPRTTIAVATASTASASIVRYTVTGSGTTTSTRPTVPAYSFSAQVIARRISSVIPKVSTAK